jgi:uncharacterized protein YjiS (DUF1127 family)
MPVNIVLLATHDGVEQDMISTHVGRPRPIAPKQSRRLRLGLLALLELWSERRRQRRALLELSDHVLKDIGISRSEALQEGRKPFWRA